MSKQFTYQSITRDELTASDLRSEIESYEGPKLVTRIIIFDNGTSLPEHAEAVYLPDEDRLGIAWGADASWATVHDFSSGIEMWLNDNEAWEQAN